MKEPEFNKDLFALGQRIRELRLLKNKSQRQLALDIGSEAPNYSKIERGLLNVTYYTLWKISNALDIEVKEFFN